MRLIVTIKYDATITLVLARQCLPECLEGCGVGDHITIVPSEVVWVNDCVRSFGIRDIVHDAGEAAFVRCIDGSGHAARDYAFHEDRDAWGSWLI